MEKKTIGKFISALRKANGMTQKELGEKLFVSDKTVSRWECDESTPELSLIPVIADIFGITSDELLRGERSNPEKDSICSEEETAKQRAKSDKQFKLMLHNRKKKYNNLSFVSLGIAIVGLIAAMICNLGFSRGALGFGLASIFYVSGIVCQLCFTISFRFLIDEDEIEYADKLKKANSDMIFTTVKILFVILMLWAFCLPIAILTLAYFDSHWGLLIESWLIFGLIFAAVGFVILYCIYKLFIIRLLINKEIVFVDEETTTRLEDDNKLLKRICIIFASVFALIMIVTFIITNVIGESEFIKKERFDDPDAFIEYVENQYNEWLEEGYPDGFLAGYPSQAKGEIDGKEYYYNPDLYHAIYIGESENGEYEIVVTTSEAYRSGKEAYESLNACLIILHIINILGCTAWYCFKVFKRKSST